jgi:hypothetical protein
MQTSLLAHLDVAGAAGTGIGDQPLGPLAGVGLDPPDHRQEMQRVTGLTADADGHDHLVVTIQGGLGAVALDPVVTALEDVTVGIGGGEALGAAVVHTPPFSAEQRGGLHT